MRAICCCSERSWYCSYSVYLDSSFKIITSATPEKRKTKYQKKIGNQERRGHVWIELTLSSAYASARLEEPQAGMEHWLSAPAYPSLDLRRDVSTTKLSRWLARDADQSPLTAVHHQNVYWVPMKRKHSLEAAAAAPSTIRSSTLSKRYDSIPSLDARSTAGVIVAVVLFVVIIMSVLMFLIWRNSRYQSKTRTLKQEAEDVVRESEIRCEMREMVPDGGGIGYGPTGLKARTEDDEGQGTTDLNHWRQLGVEHGLLDEDDGSFWTAEASIRTESDRDPETRQTR